MRILTFGYDSALIDSAATPSIQHYARALFDSLNSERKGENVCMRAWAGFVWTSVDRRLQERSRPIIFIGHSLGGLVIKQVGYLALLTSTIDSHHQQALADASQAIYENDAAILGSCIGLFFFGVPNRGLNVENLRTLVKDQKNEHFINDLREGSELLRQAYQRFLQGVELKGCQITSFFELRDTQAVVLRPDGTWKRSGEMTRVVTKESATFSLPSEAIHMQLGIDADHSNMVKFADNCDHHYIRVRDRLMECVGNAPNIIEARLEGVITGGNHEGT